LPGFSSSEDNTFDPGVDGDDCEDDGVDVETSCADDGIDDEISGSSDGGIVGRRDSSEIGEGVGKGVSTRKDGKVGRGDGGVITGEGDMGDIDGGIDGGSDTDNEVSGGDVGGVGVFVSGAGISSVRNRHSNEKVKLGYESPVFVFLTCHLHKSKSHLIYDLHEVFRTFWSSVEITSSAWLKLKHRVGFTSFQHSIDQCHRGNQFMSECLPDYDILY
jgi:hypothetical protein